MIAVNLLDYKEELRKVAMQKMIINAIGSVLFLIFLIVTYWCFQKIEIKYRANELKQLEGKVRKLTAQTTKIQSMKLQAKRTTKIIKKINELRANQFQVTQILEDLILPVPDEIWLTSVRQLGIKEIQGKKIPVIFIGDPKKMKTKKKSSKSKNKAQSKQEFLEVRGRLFGKHSDETIVRYIRRLRDSSSFAKVFLHQTNQQQNETEVVRDFTFYVYMPMKA
jgi:Tfp pilus assembly protein PilN